MTFDFDNVHVATHQFYDNNFNENAIKVLPGEYYATKERKLIVTVLGSCVSVCLRDPMTGVGGMNHFLLPTDEREDSDMLTASARYGVYAMEILINHLMKLGARKEYLQAKIFGGANVLPGMPNSKVGEKNSEFVRLYLSKEHIEVYSSDLQGAQPRKVFFFTDTGKVLIKKLKTAHIAPLVNRESVYQTDISSHTKTGDIDLF
ncbi:chemoreceptor glutamine deamidase CheD [Marinomonas sp. PE14-40]|uniref:chemoreceptor glutamine deamidase CheD n=1 Tax=Marinomonas sp. PE14-40 TaxID=3060621 RepID=UPI003F66EA83